MARYTKDLVLNKPEDFVSFMMNDYLNKNEFSMSDWKGEPAYRAGDPMLEGYKYMKWSYSNGTLHLEAWMKGSFGGEMGLDGFVGVLQKKPFKDSLEQLYTALQQEIPEGGYEQGGQSQPIPVQTVDNSQAATLSLVLGIIAIVMVLFLPIPLVVIVLGVLGVNRARLGIGSSKATLAKIGRVLSIIAVVLAIVLWVYNFLTTMGIIILG